MMTMSELGLQGLKVSTAERNAWQVLSPTLGGDRGRVQVLFHTPSLGLIATPTAKFETLRAQHVEGIVAHSGVQVGQPGVMSFRFDSGSDETWRDPREIDEVLDRTCLPRSAKWQDLDQELRYTAITLAPNQHRVPRFTVTQEANAFADAENIRTDVEVLCRLALQMLPDAVHALVTVVPDLEDGTSSLHVTVRTSAAMDEIVDAEDQLHNAMFDHLTPASRSLFSIGYEFSD